VGAVARLVDGNKSPEELRAFVKSFAHTARLPLLNGTERLPAAAGLITVLKHDSHALTTIGGGRAALWEAGGLRAGGNSQLAARHREEAAKRPRLLWIERGGNASRAESVPHLFP
jgi:hypothetical protein